MNDCRDFRTWITLKDLYDERVSNAAREHLVNCAECREVLTIDEKLEVDLKREFQKRPVPEKILERVRNQIEKEVALLKCKKNAKNVSLFIVDKADLQFNIGKHRNYRIRDHKRTITVWRDSDDLVCITVVDA